MRKARARLLAEQKFRTRFCFLFFSVQAEVDSALQAFEAEEAAEIAERKAKRESPEDDDGFVTVTYKRKRGRNSGNPGESGVTVGEGGGDKKKRKGAGELKDFYRFQVKI